MSAIEKSEYVLLDVTIDSEIQSHSKGQNKTLHQLHDFGITSCNWVMGQGTKHKWRIKCTKEQETMVRLIAVEVSTEKYDKRVQKIAELQEELDRWKQNLLNVYW